MGGQYGVTGIPYDLALEIISTLEAQEKKYGDVNIENLKLQASLSEANKKLARQGRLLKKAALLIKISDYCRTDYDKKHKWLAALDEEWKK